MRVAFFADIHGNLPALTAALEDARERGATHLICLGDIVGYGPQPLECLALVRQVASGTVIGNHDAAACGLFDKNLFNEFARETSERVSLILPDEDRAWLRDLPYLLEEKEFICAHGSFLSPEDFIYLSNKDEAELSFKLYPEYSVFVVGHTHIPCAFVKSPQDRHPRKLPPESFTLEEGTRYILNPGAVGFPRGESITADYLIFDTVTHHISFHSVPYDLAPYRLALVNNGYNLLNYWFLTPKAHQRRAELALREMAPRKVLLGDGSGFYYPRRSKSRVFSRAILIFTIFLFSFFGLVLGMMMSNSHAEEEESHALPSTTETAPSQGGYVIPPLSQWSISQFNGEIKPEGHALVLSPAAPNQAYCLISPEIDLRIFDYNYSRCTFSVLMESEIKCENLIQLTFRREDGSTRKAKRHNYKGFIQRRFTENIPKHATTVQIKLEGTVSRPLTIDRVRLEPRTAN